MNVRVVHKDDWFVFSKRTGKPIHLVSVASIFIKASNKLGFKITPHKSRHFFATQAKIEGIDIRWIADVIVHRSITSTDGYKHS